MVFLNIITGIIVISTIHHTAGNSWNSSIPYRIPRANEEEFTNSIGQMQMISRIINGIYLQQGLIKGTIPSADLISELLNLGDVKPSDIQQIDTAKLKSVVDKIQDLPSLLKTGADVEKMEELLKLLSSVVETSGIVETLSKPGNEYLKAVTDIKDSQQSWTKLNSYVDSLETFMIRLESITNDKAHVDPNAFDFIKIAITTLKSGDLSEYKDVLNSDGLSSSQIQLASLSKVYYSMLRFSNNQKPPSYNAAKDDKLLESIEANMNSVTTTTKAVQNGLSSFDQLRKIFISPHDRTKDLTIATGLPNGPSDIELLFNDLKNEWIRTAVGWPTDSMAKALDSLKSIKESAVAVENLIGGEADEAYKSVDEVSEKTKGLLDLSTTTDGPLPKLKEILKAVAVKDLLPAKLTDYRKLHEAIVGVSKRLDAFKKVYELSLVLNSKTNVEKFDRISAISSSNKQVADKANEFLSSQDVKDIAGIIKEVGPSVQLLNEKVKIQNHATAVVKNYKEMDGYIASSNNYLAMLKSVRSNGIDRVKPLIEVIRKIIGTKGAQTGNFATVVDKIGEMKIKLKQLEDSIGKMKGQKSAEIDALIALDDASEISKTIGSATRGIANMKKLLERKLDDTIFSTGIFAIKTVMKSTNLDPGDGNNLNAVINLEAQLKTLKSELTSFMASVVYSTSSKLSDHSGIFEKAKAVHGFAADFDKMIGALGKLIEKSSTSSNALKDMKEELSKLKKLKLDFSKYQTPFTNSKSSLEAAEMMFAKFGKSRTLSTTPTTVGGGTGNGSGASRGSSGSLGGGTTEAPSSWPWYYYFLIVVVCVVVSVAGIFWYCCCKSKDKKPDDNIEEGKKGKTPAIPDKPTSPGNETKNDEIKTAVPPKTENKQGADGGTVAGASNTAPNAGVTGQGDVAGSSNTNNGTAGNEESDGTGTSDVVKSSSTPGKTEENPGANAATTTPETRKTAEEVATEIFNAANKNENLVLPDIVREAADKFLEVVASRTLSKTSIANLWGEIVVDTETGTSASSELKPGEDRATSDSLESIHAKKITCTNHHMIVGKSPDVKVPLDELPPIYEALELTGSPIIVMCERLEEHGVKKCAKYYPSAGKTERFGTFTVDCNSDSSSPFDGNVEVHKMKYKKDSSPNYHPLVHIQIKHHPDVFLSNNEYFVSYVHFVCFIYGRKFMFMHCTNGVSRSGNLSFILFLVDQLVHNTFRSISASVVEFHKSLPGALPENCDLLFCVRVVVNILSNIFTDDKWCDMAAKKLEEEAKALKKSKEKTPKDRRSKDKSNKTRTKRNKNTPNKSVTNPVRNNVDKPADVAEKPVEKLNAEDKVGSEAGTSAIEGAITVPKNDGVKDSEAGRSTNVVTGTPSSPASSNSNLEALGTKNPQDFENSNIVESTEKNGEVKAPEAAKVEIPKEGEKENVMKDMVPSKTKPPLSTPIAKKLTNCKLKKPTRGGGKKPQSRSKKSKVNPKGNRRKSGSSASSATKAIPPEENSTNATADV